MKSSRLLVHCDSGKDLLLAGDASPYSLGAVLSHRMADNTEQPIAFASRSLTSAEKNYSQLDKEALAIVFTVRKLHQYLYFTILRDHKSLKRVFNPDKTTPQMAAARIQCLALILAAYTYNIQYKEGSQNTNADAFMISRLPLPDTPTSIPVLGEAILLMELLENTPVKAKEIRKWTRISPVLATVLNFMKQGWPSKCPNPALEPYFQKRDELSVQNDCIHPGICKMKSLARSYVWWQNMDSTLKNKVRTCNHCQIHRKNPPEAPLHPWEQPSRPCERGNIDYAGPFLRTMFLIMVDAYSKWLEVHPTKATTSRATIEKLWAIFATCGISTTLASDNGSNFCSEEFEDF